ncbi:MAG: hypothetical protein MR846_01445 [Tenericutes bacterium]|nr:hypothetical protein [Mycoplasmatota bacterium]MDD6941862.1 hypothetical protein [bacterium]MDY2696665.1 hypothetical protein [Bacilli bacterium]
MKKNNFNPLSEYYDLYYETGTFDYKKNTVSLDGKIEDTIFDIIVDLNDVSRFDMSLDIVDKMFRLSSLITERFCNGKVFEPTNEMLTLLSRELAERLKNSDYNPYLVIGTGDVIKSVNLLLGDEAILSIETFDEDRFKNDLMVSCNRVRNTRPVTSSRVVSPNYIFGDNGIYINAGNKSFLDVFGKSDTEDFDSLLDLKYYYIDYSRPEERVLVDRAHGLKDTITDTGEVKLGSFHAPMLNGIILGALKHSDEQILNFINRSSTNDENIVKVYRKVNE